MKDVEMHQYAAAYAVAALICIAACAAAFGLLELIWMLPKWLQTAAIVMLGIAVFAIIASIVREALFPEQPAEEPKSEEPKANCGDGN